MAKKENTPNPQSTSNIDTDIFVKGMTKDPNISLVGKDQWTHARNAINNSVDGDVGTLGNEQANYLCESAPFTIIGAIHLYGDKWVLFSTNNEQSEIGTWDDSNCKYKTLINDYSGYMCLDGDSSAGCLNFSTQHLITGAAKENFDCTWQVYWDDSINPSRTLNLDVIPWVKIITSDESEECVTYANIMPLQINCEELRLAPLIDTPCIEISKSPDGGMLRNGTYQVFIAYVINDQTVGDYYGISNIQPLWEHEDTISGLDIKLSNLDKGFENFKLVICSNNQMEMQAKEIGIYSTEQEFISIDYINQKLKTVPIEFLPLRNPAYEKSDNMYIVNDYLIRQGPTEQFDFNYQPLANEVHTHWTSWQFPADYYRKGGNKPTFMRDEVYSFFIRFIYNTGEKSSSFHIPGRVPGNYTLPDGSTAFELDTLPGDPSEIGSTMDNAPQADRTFEIYNTCDSWWGASSSSAENNTTDGGVKTAEGHMAYWESSELYPNDPVRYGELCSKPIRHHKFPDETIPAGSAGISSGGNGILDRSSNDNQSINILGVRFSNIQWPRFNGNSDPNNLCDPLDPSPTGDLIPNIVGYEILVGSREGNKSIIAKGISRNMREYDIPDSATGHETSDSQLGAISNYPFNDLGSDPYLSSNNDFTYTNGVGDIQNINEYPAANSYQDLFTFHSPETSFNRPYLNPYEIKTYGVTTGTALGRFKASEKHPKQKLLRNISMWIGIFVGMGYAFNEMRGKRTRAATGPKALSIGYTGSGEEIGGGKFKSGNLTSGSTQAWTNLGGAGNAYANLSPSSQTANEGGDWEAGAPGSSSLDLTNIDLTLGASASAAQVVQSGLEVTESSVVSIATVIGAPKLANQLVYVPTTIGGWGAVTTSMGGKGFVGGGETIEYEGARFEALPSLMQLAYGAYEFMQYTATGGQEIIDLILELVSYQDYAYKYNAHGLYFKTNPIASGNRHRTRVDVARYIGSTMQQLTSTIKINNIQRPKTVVVKTDSANSLFMPTPLLDQSRFIIGSLSLWYRPTALIQSSIAAHYTAIKVKFANQYGQLDQINQVPIRGCVTLFKDQPLRDADGVIIPFDNLNVLSVSGNGIFKTPSLFGGDCYLNRYTEKVIMPFFWDFLEGQPDGFPYDYRLRANVPRPIYWMNSQKYDLSELVRTITNLNFDFTGGALPSNLFALDRDGNDVTSDQGGAVGAGTSTSVNLTSQNQQGGAPTSNNSPSAGDSTVAANSGTSLFHIKNGYMYTHNSGINDFFVESEINTALRDWEDVPEKRHYDWMEYTDVNDLFDASIIKKGNFFKYDPSLSKNRFFSQLISFGLIQPRDYDPIVSANCYMHYPKRLIYSLQAQKEAKKDFWRVFLPNNYKDFKDKVNVIKPVSKSGAVVLFPNLAPSLFQGVDELQTDLGTKLTIGDGGLFGKPMQNIVNADEAHEYGSCESQRSVVNTPSGLFYISQAQGKIFHYTGQGLDNIANQGMKQWFNKYLPSNLLSHYPEMEDCQGWVDNPVAGVGCQTIYDPNFDIVYFCKKDYEPITPECIDFLPCEGFVWNQSTCNGVEPKVCCPPDNILPDGTIQTYVYNPSNPAGEECEAITTYAAIETIDQELGDVDIVIAVDSSNSIPGGATVARMQNFVNDFILGMATELGTGQAQIALVHFGGGRNQTAPVALGQGGATAGNDEMFDPGQQLMLTSSSSDLSNWVTNVYGPSTGSGTNTGSDSPWGTSVIGGLWCGLNLLYGTNSRAVNKKIITIIDGPQSTDSGINQTTLTSPQDIYQNMVVSPTTPDTVPPLVGMGNDSAAQVWSNNSGIHTWWQNIMNSPNYADLESYAVCINPYNQDPNTAANGASWRNYTDGLAHPGNGYYGSFNTVGSTEVITDAIVNAITPPPIITWSCADPDCDLILTTGSQYLCECKSYHPVSYIDSVIPISITDEQYFKDVSWTVSYDPKSKAWMSFHDWHPDLVIPSLNHFFTTKNFTDESEPQCPPGFTWNPSTMTCCQTFQGEFLADVNIEEAPVEVEIEPIPCKLDIVISCDTSGSMNSPPVHPDGGGQNWGAARTFINDFVCAIAPDMIAGNTQVGLTYWSNQQAIFTPESRSGTVNGITYLQSVLPNGTGSGTAADPRISMTNNPGYIFDADNVITGCSFAQATQPFMMNTLMVAGYNHGQGVLSDVCNSSLGDRTIDSGYRRIMIFLGDGASNDGAPNGCNEQGMMDGPVCDSGADSAAAAAGQQVMSRNITIFASPGGGNPGTTNGFDGVSCTPGAYPDANQWNVNTTVGGSPSPKDVASQISNGLCALPPVCSCPSGYTRVSSQSTGTAPPYQILGPSDDCTDKNRSGICRKIECECNVLNLPNPGIPMTQTGECDSITESYNESLIGGNPLYINPLPLTCHYDYECCLDATFEKGGIWKHNDRCDLYSNYYGKDHPWEVEWVEAVGQTVNTVRSIEYQLESYIYKGNLGHDCGDRFHDLDWNFDEAIIHNTEQVSGILSLTLDPKNDVPLITQYPIITGNDIEILYSKVEQKYRFNQFWDITKDRGEFDPNANASIFITQLNGYIRDLNQANLNYFKPAFQRKKFRHYWNSVILRKNISGNRKMLLKLANTKINMSFR